MTDFETLLEHVQEIKKKDQLSMIRMHNLILFKEPFENHISKKDALIDNKKQVALDQNFIKID